MKEKINKNVVRRIINLGSSYAITLPSEIMKVYDLKTGDFLDLTINEKIEIRDKITELQSLKNKIKFYEPDILEAENNE